MAPRLSVVWDRLLQRYDADFPNLLSDGFAFTSPWEGHYNCIAWAAADSTKWWWPVRQLGPGVHWPDECAREVTLDAFLHAFRVQGYALCENGSHFVGIEKIAIYADAQDVPTHCARQLPNGAWTSKLGQNYDILHRSPESLEGGLYGVVAAYMERHRPGDHSAD